MKHLNCKGEWAPKWVHPPPLILPDGLINLFTSPFFTPPVKCMQDENTGKDKNNKLYKST